MTPMLAHRLRELDLEVEHLRAALAALQRSLEARRGPQALRAPAAARAEEWLRAYA